MNRKPPELHLIDGTTSRAKDKAIMLPTSIKKRIPKAEWLDNPDAWDKERFITETADFLFEVYGIGSDQDKHLLAMLAEHIETFINANRSIKRNTLIVTFNNGATPGPNPMLSIRKQAAQMILQLMNELGLSPRGRLSANKTDDNSRISKLLKGPLG